MNRPLDLEPILANSYRNFHAKGLDYICLRRSPEETWKVYFFDGDASKGPEVVFPHDHRYAFDTTVLSGAVENVLYAEGDEGEVFNKFSWRTPLNPGPSGFTFASEVRLRELSRVRYKRWQLYRMDVGETHTLRIASSGTVLLLLQYADRVPLGVPTNTYSRGDAPSLKGLYRRFKADELLGRVREFRQQTGLDLLTFRVGDGQ